MYGAGYTDATYSMVIDYAWKSDSLASTMVKDEYAGTFDKEGALAAVEIAKDFEVDEENHHLIILRILWCVSLVSLLLLVSRRQLEKTTFSLW